MSRVKLVALLAALVVLPLMPARAIKTADDPEAWKGLTKDQIERVKKGEIVLLDKDTSEGGQQKRMIEAAMIFDQPIAAAWKLFRQTENQARYLPDLESCTLVSRDAKGDQVDFHVKLVININYRIHHVYDDENCCLHWSLDPSYDNDMKRVDGFWRLYKIDDKHTLARYGTWVEVSSVIPDFLMERLTKSNLPVNMEAVYKYIQSGGTWVKPGYKGN
jgi:hypothetical protein